MGPNPNDIASLQQEITELRQGISERDKTIAVHKQRIHELEKALDQYQGQKPMLGESLDMSQPNALGSNINEVSGVQPSFISYVNV